MRHYHSKPNHALVAKLGRAVFMINRDKNLLPQNALITLYHSMFHCHLLYCASLISCTNKNNVEKIAKLQKKAIRIATHSHHLAHTEPIFTSLEILPLHSIITKARLLFMHSIYHGYASTAFQGQWTQNADREVPYHLRNGIDFALPRVNYSCLQKLPFYSFAETWNNRMDE
jgi:hypothetical protein